MQIGAGRDRGDPSSRPLTPPRFSAIASAPGIILIDFRWPAPPIVVIVEHVALFCR